MAYIITDKEINAVINLNAQKRYKYFIKRIVDDKAIWGLHDNKGWCLIADTRENELLPIWSNLSYANLCISDQWIDCEPKKIMLNSFLEKWITGMKKDKKMFAIFPICSPAKSIDKGIVITPERLYDDILNELENY